jgi:glutaredoxin-like protein
MAMLSEENKKIIREKFNNEMKDNIEILFFFKGDEECEYCSKTGGLLDELAELDNRIKIRKIDFRNDKTNVDKYKIEFVPAIVFLTKDGKDKNVRLYGIPGGYEFNTLLEDIIYFSNGAVPEIDDKVAEKIKKIDRPTKISVFITMTCPYCPKAVLAAQRFAMINNNITAEMIEASEFENLSNEMGVSSVPHIVVNRDSSKSFVGAQPDDIYANYIVDFLG